jgi:hypothetical protein
MQSVEIQPAFRRNISPEFSDFASRLPLVGFVPGFAFGAEY